MANSTYWLVASNLHHRLPDGRELYSGLELSLGPGITALISENGTGKSTLAAQLVGLLTGDDSARIIRHGHIGFLPQQAGRPQTGCLLADYLGRPPSFMPCSASNPVKGKGPISRLSAMPGLSRRSWQSC